MLNFLNSNKAPLYLRSKAKRSDQSYIKLKAFQLTEDFWIRQFSAMKYLLVTTMASSLRTKSLAGPGFEQMMQYSTQSPVILFVAH